MQSRRAVSLETIQKINVSASMEDEQKKNHSAPPRKTACGNVWCECSRIMAHLDLTKTPYFLVKHPDKRCGPTLPDEFVQEHGDEASGNVILDAARTAGQVLAVEFVKEEDEETGELKSIRIGQGWESFVVRNQLQAPDLLFFTLQGPSRFIVMMIRGHTRHAMAEDPAPRKHHLAITDDLEESTAELWHAAKKRKRGPDPPPTTTTTTTNNNNNNNNESDSAIFVTCISSDDTLGSYRLLSDDETSGASGDSSDVDDEDCSDFEDEFEFRRTRHLVS